MLLSMLTKFWSVGTPVLKRAVIRALLCLSPAKKKEQLLVVLPLSKLLEKISLTQPYQRTFLVTLPLLFFPLTNYCVCFSIVVVFSTFTIQHGLEVVIFVNFFGDPWKMLRHPNKDLVLLLLSL